MNYPLFEVLLVVFSALSLPFFLKKMGEGTFFSLPEMLSMAFATWFLAGDFFFFLIIKNKQGGVSLSF
jgi:hypothetical protein